MIGITPDVSEAPQGNTESAALISMWGVITHFPLLWQDGALTMVGAQEHQLNFVSIILFFLIICLTTTV
jgi:hypothetical protein